MALLYRVRRATSKGPVVDSHVNRLSKAMALARQTARQSRKAVRVERKVARGWETVTVVQPEFAHPVEQMIARGIRPRVAHKEGNRQGRVQSYIIPTRECWVCWDGATEEPPEKVAVDDLALTS